MTQLHPAKPCTAGTEVARAARAALSCEPRWSTCTRGGAAVQCRYAANETALMPHASTSAAAFAAHDGNSGPRERAACSATTRCASCAACAAVSGRAGPTPSSAGSTPGTPAAQRLTAPQASASASAADSGGMGPGSASSGGRKTASSCLRSRSCVTATPPRAARRAAREPGPSPRAAASESSRPGCRVRARSR